MHASVQVQSDYQHGAATLRRTTDYDLSSLQLSASWSFAPRWTLEVAAPLRRIATRTEFRDPGGGLVEGLVDPHFPDETLLGLADLSTAIRFRLLGTTLPSAWLLDVRAGLYWPTGQIAGAASTAVQDARHQPMFFGNGTVDPMADALLIRFVGAFRLALMGSLRAPVLQNNNGFRGPTLVGGSFSVDRDLGTRKFRLSAALSASRDAVGTSSFAGLTLFWLPALGWQVAVGSDLPLYVRGDEVEVSPAPSVRVSITRAIGL